MVHRALLGSVERFFGILIGITPEPFPLGSLPCSGNLSRQRKSRGLRNHVFER